LSKIVKITDFVGFHYLAQSCIADPTLQHYADRYEKQYLVSLLGEDYTAFYASLDVNNPPVDVDVLAWYDPFVATNGCSLHPFVTNGCSCSECYMLSEGVKDMLVGFVFYHYAHDNQISASLTGMVFNNNENSVVATPEQAEAYILERYNESVRTYNAIMRERAGGTCCVSNACYLEVITTVI